MYLSDCHTHSRLSPDARDDMCAMAAAAVAAGLREICFTDHFEPVEWRSATPRKSYDWAALTREYAAAQDAWGEKLSMRLGVELGDAPFDTALTERLLDSAPPLDFVIGSIHMLSARFEHRELAWTQEADEETCYREIEDYLALAGKLARWGKFDVLGHLTLPIRYMNDCRGFHVEMERYDREIETILRTLIESGRGIELNTNHGGRTLPGKRWLTLYRSLGGEIITIGSDAHRADEVGRGVREGQALLRACGFTRFCTFRERKPVFHAL